MWLGLQSAWGEGAADSRETESEGSQNAECPGGVHREPENCSLCGKPTPLVIGASGAAEEARLPSVRVG